MSTDQDSGKRPVFLVWYTLKDSRSALLRIENDRKVAHACAEKFAP